MLKLLVVEEDSLPLIIYVKSKTRKPLVYGVFSNKQGSFIQKCDKKFIEARERLSLQEFESHFCSF